MCISYALSDRIATPFAGKNRRNTKTPAEHDRQRVVLAKKAQADSASETGNRIILRPNLPLILFPNENAPRCEANFSRWLTRMKRSVAALR
jgi:hypothetical protein